MIAHITATFPPYWAGTGNVAYHNARLLYERGYEVTVFTAATARDAELTFPFRVSRLPALLRLGNAPFTPGLLRALGRFKLIHLHYPYIFGADLALLASRRYRIPLILTYHNRLLEKQPLKRLLFSLYNATSEPLLLQHASKLLAVRKDHFQSLFPRFSGPVEELSNGVDTAVFVPQDKQRARRALGLAEGQPVALFVGALDQAHRFKNLGGLLEAFANVPSPNAQLLVVGEGDLRPSLERDVATLGLGARVHFLGARPPAALPAIYSAADVTVLPSTAVESFGLVLLESLSCATPVIATDLPGVRTLIQEAEAANGVLVPPGDGAALTDALTGIFQDPQAAQAMGHRGRQRVLTSYDWQVVGDRLERLYQEVLSA